MVIESRSDYLLFVTLQLKDMPISNKFRKLLTEICMNGFDDGFALTRDGQLDYDKFKDFKCHT